MTRILLVTGSRSLATREGAEAWARAILRDALACVDLLLVGDADGPDAWARAAGAAGEGHRLWWYCTKGWPRGLIRQWDGMHCEDVPWAPRGTSTHPLDRNAAMVRDAARMLRDGDDVRVLALLDGLKTDTPTRRATRGTEHTVGLAERAGLTVVERVWPRDAAKGATT